MCQGTNTVSGCCVLVFLIDREVWCFGEYLKNSERIIKRTDDSKIFPLSIMFGQLLT